MKSVDELRAWFNEMGFCDDGTIYTMLNTIEIEHSVSLQEQADEIHAKYAEEWVELPRDINDEIIHLGDDMADGQYRFKAYSLSKTYGAQAWSVHAENGAAWACCDIHHYQKPTVEDVLREFGDRYCDATVDSDEERELFAEYAAKLRLIEED